MKREAKPEQDSVMMKQAAQPGRSAPGKRALASGSSAGARAPIQRMPAKSGPAGGQASTGGAQASAQAGDWTDVVFRPDLNSAPGAPVQRKTEGGDGAPGALDAGAAPNADAQDAAPQISYDSLMHWAQSSLNVLMHQGGLSGIDEPLDVDGKNGPKTRAAIKAFQRAAPSFGVEEELDVDGLVGPRTTLALETATGTTNPTHRPAEKTDGPKGQGGAQTNDPANDQANTQTDDQANTQTDDTAGAGGTQGTGGQPDVVHEEGDETAGKEEGQDTAGESAIEAPSSLSSKALKSYFNDCLAARYGDKGMLSQMIQIKVSSYKVADDPAGATVSQDAAAAWQNVAAAIDALDTDTRQFSTRVAIAMEGGAKFATCKVSFSRRTMTKADDKTIAASLIKADASHCLGGARQVAEETYEAFKGLYAAAQTSGFISEFPDFCKITSAYRSVATQEKLFAKKVASLVAEGQSQSEAEKNARKWVARPGGSAHHTGHALDLKVWPDSLSSSNAKKMMDANSSFHKKYAKYWEWLKENAPKYGFLPYAAEPWHWEKCK